MRLKVLTMVGGVALVAALLIPGLVLGAGGTNHLHAGLTGAQAVPAGSGAPAGSGHARVTLQPHKKQVCFKIHYQKIGSTKGLQAGIYAGVKGSNGDLAATLFKGQEKSPVQGCAPISSANLQDIRTHPHRFNVALQTNKYPHGGAIRGQLKATP
jgi:CHRD domain